MDKNMELTILFSVYWAVWVPCGLIEGKEGRNRKENGGYTQFPERSPLI